jgi:hypothetical protein
VHCTILFGELIHIVINKYFSKLSLFIAVASRRDWHDDDDRQDRYDLDDEELLALSMREPRQVWDRTDPLVKFRDEEFLRHFR